jgi:hypothetical protein
MIYLEFEYGFVANFFALPELVHNFLVAISSSKGESG